MSDNRKYYYLKLKESYFDDDAIVLLESMQDGMLYSNILLKLYLKSLKYGGTLQLDENIPYTAQMIATITRQQVGTFLGNLVGLNGNSFTDKISMQNMTANAWLFIVSVVLCMPVIPALKKKLESKNLYLATSVGQTVLNVAVFALSSILLVNATNNPFIYWQF